jgi:hypothetical protein
MAEGIRNKGSVESENGDDSKGVRRCEQIAET